MSAKRGPTDLMAFAGEWTIARRIEDRMVDQLSRFEGSARFSGESDRLRYHETGVLTLPDGTSFQADRDYVWAAEGDRIRIYFADGRFFHDLTLNAQAEAAHFCDSDDYAVTYDFGTWPNWRATWRVTGPRKNYTMVSDYSPA